MKTLNFILTFFWFDKYAAGEKGIEYRRITPYWTKRILSCAIWHFDTEKKIRVVDSIYATAVLRRGYSNKCLVAEAYKIEIVDGNKSDLHIDEKVYAIYLRNIHKQGKAKWN